MSTAVQARRAITHFIIFSWYFEFVVLAIVLLILARHKQLLCALLEYAILECIDDRLFEYESEQINFTVIHHPRYFMDGIAKVPGALFNFIICISRFTAVFTPLKHKLTWTLETPVK
ncbi:hypothetical protein PRIPAC_87696 [Pristionchus pacificus]|uniref:Uncharacterized protein n=1 Tax=Pristionchus pacificus TaxID=54126 RepID=A0A2A6CVN1_PRIPA|nr:hypothetical protein PRIPAC_87696 [Pristionchus pacificus]|eukprot:PDM82107.1 hypothetical protein PRIPAC_36500 [Pristionchus pacificus]